MFDRALTYVADRDVMCFLSEWVQIPRELPTVRGPSNCLVLTIQADLFPCACMNWLVNAILLGRRKKGKPLSKHNFYLLALRDYSACLTCRQTSGLELDEMAFLHSSFLC